jgi:hypothetical protein
MRLWYAVTAVVVAGLGVLACGLTAAEPPDPKEMIGQPAPGWKGVGHWINLPEGKEALDVADYRGKVLILVFCQKTCPGSQQNMLPLVKALAEHCGGHPKVAFVVIQTAFKDFGENTPAAVQEMADTHKLTMPFGHVGAEGQPPRIIFRYKALGTPWLIVIDAAGKVRRSGYQFKGQEIVDEINRLLPEAAGQETQPPEPPEPPPPPEPKPLSPEAEKLKEQLQTVSDRFDKAAAEEMGIRVRIMELQQKARQIIEDEDEAAKALAKGQKTKELKAYEALLAACVRQLRAFEAKFASVGTALANLRKDPAADEVKDDFDRLARKVEQRRTNLLNEIADFCVKAGRLDEAVAMYERLRDLLPEDAKDLRTGYLEKTGNAYEKFEKWNKALTVFVRIYDAMPEKERKADINLRLKLGNLYQAIGNYTKALEFYEGVKKDLPAGQKVEGLDDAIERMKKRG